MPTPLCLNLNYSIHISQINNQTNLQAKREERKTKEVRHAEAYNGALISTELFDKVSRG